MEDDSGVLKLEALRACVKKLVDVCDDVELLDLVCRLLLCE